MPRRAALFDMDKTLVRVNTAALYVRWQVRNGEAGRPDVARLMWWLAQYSFGVVDAEAIARQAAQQLRGVDEEAFRAKMRNWVRADVEPHIAPLARDEVRSRKAQGYVCAVLTSATGYSAVPLAEMMGIDHVLGSRLEVRDGRFTGDYLRPLCYAQGKVAAAEAWARDHEIDLDDSVFYTDSISDLPMLQRVREPVAVNPDPRLRLLAWRRNWRTVVW